MIKKSSADCWKEYEKVIAEAMSVPEQKLLVIYRDNWADEFNIQGFSVMLASEWGVMMENAKQKTYPRSMGFGTNQEIMYNTCEDFFLCFEILPIGEDKYRALRESFGWGFGFWPDSFFEKNWEE
jgi:hypothetical protein